MKGARKEIKEKKEIELHTESEDKQRIWKNTITEKGNKGNQKKGL